MPGDKKGWRGPQSSDLPTPADEASHLQSICIAYLTGLQPTPGEIIGMHRRNSAIVFARLNDPVGGEPPSRSEQQHLPSRKTRPQSAQSDAEGHSRPHYPGVDNQLNKAMLTSCRRPDRGKIPKAFLVFPRDCVRKIRLIVCKSCTMNVNLRPNHINELSVAWSELSGRRGAFLPSSQSSPRFGLIDMHAP